MNIFEIKISIPFFLNIAEVRPPPNYPPSTCERDPCGPNSRCELEGPRVVCHCLPGFFGKPPNCRPECLISEDCAANEACIRNKCTDPCQTITCGELIIASYVPKSAKWRVSSCMSKHQFSLFSLI